MGRTPIIKNSNHIHILYDKGATPIAKNIIVVDEQGNEYEATYPKRAKGLVKNGRARFVDENTICLACPPSELEDNDMSEQKLSMNYILEQIEKIMADTEYLHKTIDAIVTIGPAAGPGDICGSEKAQALATVVECRETTNQKMLALYEKMYDDLKPQKPTEPAGMPANEKLTAVLTALETFENVCTSVDVDEAMLEGLNAMVATIKQL